MVIRLELYHYNSQAFDNLRSQFKGLQLRLQALEKDYRLLELKYGSEVQFNATLIDLLKANGINYRNNLAHTYRYRNEP